MIMIGQWESVLMPYTWKQVYLRAAAANGHIGQDVSRFTREDAFYIAAGYLDLNVKATNFEQYIIPLMINDNFLFAILSAGIVFRCLFELHNTSTYVIENMRLPYREKLIQGI